MRTFRRRSFAPLCAALAVATAALLVLGAPAAQAQRSDLLSEFEDKVTTFKLDNGLTFVVVERHDAPVASFVTYADVGSVDEPVGQTGIAHMFEHMAFKGTTTIGTENIERELELLEKQEEIAQKLRLERAEGTQADTARINELEAQLKKATERAKEPVVQNEFDRILSQAGMQGMNASTSADATRYFYSLPANKIELFFALESDRFKNPVLREFYTERDVVMEERRTRTESSPQGRLIEEMLAAAFKAHPYGQPTVGHMSDLQSLTRTQARAFYSEYYVPTNLTIAIAGDVQPRRVRELARQYFGDIEEQDPAPPVTTVEPDQISERRVILREQSQPIVGIGYHRPSGQSEEDAAYTVLADVLGGGRTSRFYKQLQETEKALAAQAVPSFPGDQYAGLFILFGVPNTANDVGPRQMEKEMYAVIEEIKEEGITQEELERAKTSARVSLINGLDSNMGLALQLAQAEQTAGSWKHAFRQVEEIQNVTAADVQEVARETFTRDNRTVAYIKNTEDAEPSETAVASPSEQDASGE